jgi:hypothetical protein
VGVTAAKVAEHDKQIASILVTFDAHRAQLEALDRHTEQLRKLTAPTATAANIHHIKDPQGEQNEDEGLRQVADSGATGVKEGKPERRPRPGLGEDEP